MLSLNRLVYSLLIYFYTHKLFQITENYSFLPREAVTKFLSQCHDCRKSMKTNLTLDIVDKNDHHDNSNKEAFKSSNNQLSFIASGLKQESEDYPKNIENYYLLLKALHENSSMLSRIKDDPIHEQSCEKKFESFKENIIANQIHNNEIPNQQQLLLLLQQQQQQQIYRKNININIKNDSDRNSMKDIIINSLDVSINVASKPTTTNNYGNVKILCSTTTPSINITTPHSTSPPPSPSFTSIVLPSMMSDNQDINLVTSSSSAEQDEEIKINLVHDSAVTSAAAISANSISNEKNNNNFTSNNANSSESNPTRAVRNNHGVENFRCYAIPDDMSFDYHNIKNYYDDKTTTSSSLSNTKKYQAPSPTPLRTICDDDYHDSKEMPSIDITKHNKHHNNSTNIKPITSTYLRLTRSWGIWDEDALNLVSQIFTLFLLYV